MNIKIYENRKLLNETDNFGSQHENLATTLIFEFPEYVEKDGIQFPTKDLNKTIVFDIEGDNELPIIDDKFSFPYDITKLGEVVWNIALKEKSETEDMTDKLIWYSETMKSTFIKTNEGHNEITTKKIDVFNSMLTNLKNATSEVEELKIYIEDFKKDVESGKFNGKDGVDGKDGQDGYSPVRGKDYWTEEDKIEILNEVDSKVREDYYLKSETYNKQEIDNKISVIPKFDIKVVDSLPTENIEDATLYLVKSGEESSNLYTEYIYANEKWEQLGTQKLDLSYLATKLELQEKEKEIIAKLNNKVEKENNKSLVDNETISWLGTVKENYDSDTIEKGYVNHAALTPDYNVYTVRFPKWDTSNTCAGEKLDANADRYLNLATDTVYEETNYSEAFKTYDCNAYVDENGVRHITAIRGMPNFKDTGKVDVFVLLRTYWEKFYEDEKYIYYSRTYMPRNGFTVVVQAINKDGSINPWFTIAKHVAGIIVDENGKRQVYSSKGLKPARYIANPVGACANDSDTIHYADNISRFKRRGKYYTAGLMADYKHIKTTIWLKFATKNSQSVIAGLTNYNYQYMVAQAEENVSRVILTTAQANNLEVNTFVSVGEMGENTNKDRAFGYMHSLANDVEIIGKEVIDDTYTALILDCEPFTTTLTTCVSTMHEHSGYSDFVLGRNGSRVSNTNGHHGAVIDGIECFVGGYEVPANAFMNLLGDDYSREVYITNDATKLTNSAATAMTTYKKLEKTMKTTASNVWKYITEECLDLENGISYPTSAGESGSGSSTGFADGYFVDTGTSGQREFLLLGGLYNGALAGVSIVHGYGGLWYASWSFLARLSINAVGGELAE